MASAPDPKAGWVTVKTTLPVRPLPPNASRAAVTTDRLLIRPLTANDLQALHALRTQPEVMANTIQNRPDRDLEETRPRLAAFLAPNDEKTFNCAICLRETGELIGIGGCHTLSSMFGWPMIGYMFRHEHWGRGIATEFLAGWLGAWSRLPRQEAEILADPRLLPPGTREGDLVSEMVTATTIEENAASTRVLEKGGFERCLTWREPDLRNPEVELEVRAFRYFPTRQSEE